VMDREHHGGLDKAVYAYGLNRYAHWKRKFPNADWKIGMFGENLTIDELDESKMLVGSIYKVGEAQVQVCQPRQPCFKLGIRFHTQAVLKQFVNSPYPGVYFRVLKPGKVGTGDIFQLLKEEKDSPSIAEVFQLLFHKTEYRILVEKAVKCEFLPEKCKRSIVKMQS
ncbi:MAG: MOSC domain-containing protein, partial [Flavobacteriales bacterium]|nr:MOSC domain-containing protein [Flavobacteriales bacterium]